jgi:hypothetical protein
VKGIKKGTLYFHINEGDQPKLGHGYKLDIDDFEAMWVLHPDPNVDVAVVPFGPIYKIPADAGVKVFFKAIPESLLATAQQLEQLSVLQRVVFIGYPNGLWDSATLLPILRTGSTATLPRVDFQGRPQFLIDGSVFPGSSGSPVFVFDEGSYQDGAGAFVVGGTRVILLGIVAAVHYRTDKNEVQLAMHAPDQKQVVVSKEMIDIGVVFNHRALTEAIYAAIKQYKIS